MGADTPLAKILDDVIKHIEDLKHDADGLVEKGRFTKRNPSFRDANSKNAWDSAAKNIIELNKQRQANKHSKDGPLLKMSMTTQIAIVLITFRSNVVCDFLNAKIAKQAKNTRRVSIKNSSRVLRLLRDLRVYSLTHTGMHTGTKMM